MAETQPLLAGAANDPTLDVLIVGGGPVGLLSAIELASRGCNVRIIDNNDEQVIKTKASGIAARSLEILPEAVVAKIIRNAGHVKHANIYEYNNDGKALTLADIPMNAMAGRHKDYFGLRSQQQWKTEEFLMEHLATLPGCLKIERSMSLVDFTEKADCVECELKKSGSDASERVTAKFLLGCDGGSSIVRKKLGFSFEGEVTSEYFLALHAGFDGYENSDPTEVAIYCSRSTTTTAGKGFAFNMPMPDGGYLCTADLDDSQQKEWLSGEKDRHGMPILKVPTAQDICRVLSERGMGQNLSVKEGTVKWVQAFRVNSRQAEHYGKGRVYLAGDACHCHSPLGGQGMNMGFNDAKNIAWKLAFAAKGALPLSVLASYEVERYGIEKKICHAIENAQKVMSLRSDFGMFIRGRGQRLGPILLQLSGQADEAMKYGTQQAWSYSGSPLVVEHWERPSLSLASICPAGGFRRRQNLYRWIGPRVRAGDGMSEGKTEDGSSIQHLVKEGRGWSLLLFQGTPEGNADNSRFITETLSCDQLRTLGDSMKVPRTDFVSGIDTVIVLPFDRCQEAHEAFGVRGQCLMLVRPDFHVGLRSEPVRAGVVYRYFKEACSMEKPPVKQESAPANSAHKDMLPVMLWATITVGLGAWLAYARLSQENSSGQLGNIIIGAFLFSCFVNCMLYKISKPPH